MKKLIYKLQNKFVRTCGNDIDFTTMQNMIKENSEIVLIDVRTKDEYYDNHLKHAVNIPLQDICEKEIEKYVKSKNNIIIVYCEYGGRSKKALKKLNKMGYMNVYNLDGGIDKIENN